jgi:putative peptidoglycan lipid II flippase
VTGEPRPQTAIQGVAFSTSVNVCSRIVSFLRQVLITAYFGLSFRLDAFFVATSFLAIFIITFGDVFDSAGIPSLVKTREREGQESFRGLTGSIFSLALLMGGGLTLLMVLCLPLAPLIVPGFPGQSTGYIHENLLFLLPYALVFLPYHAIGSFFRSIRAFHVYYLVEFLVNLTALVAVFAFGNSIWIVPLSLSLGYLVGFAVFLAWGRGRFRFRGKLRGGEMDNVRSTIRKMLPVYILIYGLIIVDRYFASFLEEGAISALFYGYILATAVPLIMNVENVFVTPLSEESDRSALLTRILSGMWMVAHAFLFGGIGAGVVRAGRFFRPFVRDDNGGAPVFHLGSPRVLHAAGDNADSPDFQKAQVDTDPRLRVAFSQCLPELSVRVQTWDGVEGDRPCDEHRDVVDWRNRDFPDFPDRS